MNILMENIYDLSSIESDKILIYLNLVCRFRNKIHRAECVILGRMRYIWWHQNSKTQCSIFNSRYSFQQTISSPHDEDTSNSIYEFSLKLTNRYTLVTKLYCNTILGIIKNTQNNYVYEESPLMVSVRIDGNSFF